MEVMNRRKDLKLIITQFITVLIFTVIMAFIIVNANILFTDYLLAIIVKLFSFYILISVWEDLVKNINKKNANLAKKESNKEDDIITTEGGDNNDDSIDYAPRVDDDILNDTKI